MKGINLTLPHEPPEEHEDGNGGEVDKIEDSVGVHFLLQIEVKPAMRSGR